MVWLVSSVTALLLAAVLIVGAYFLPKKLDIKYVLRPAAILLMAVLIVRFLSEEVAVYVVRGLDMYSPFGDDMLSTFVSIILIWFSYAAVFTTVLNEFYDFKALKHVVYYFSVPMMLIDIALFEKLAIGTFGQDGYNFANPLLWMLVAEIALTLAIPLSRAFREKRYPIPGKGEILNTVLAVFGAILPFTPSFAPQAIIGFVGDNYKLLDISEPHRYALYLAIIIPFIIFHLLKDKSPEAKYFALLYLSYGGLWTYVADRTFLEWIIPYNWPLHLCNFAMFVIAAALAFKWKKLFYFTMFINVMGAVLAMLMPNYEASLDMLSRPVVYFWFNHYMAFFMPILIIALKVFERPKFKEWGYAQIGFAGYYLIVLFSNAFMTAYYGQTVDFFFINSDFIAEKLGPWAESLLEITLEVEAFGLTVTFYPVYQVLYYLGYVLISAGMWFLYELLFRIWDQAQDRRERERAYKDMRKKLKEYLGGKSITEPASGDGSPSIVLREFSKRYGNNKHYSVNKVSFEVKGGEIFGFLGPNGAGKSTIIKSMVGIQTITSGDIEICGYSVEMQPVQAKYNLGFVPDHYALYENLTGREYINYIADLYDVDREYRDTVIERLVNRFQLTGSFDNQMKTYSHGMKQKIAIMAALVHNPKVWILDEPLTGLDPTSIHEVKECMKEHAAAGNIVFFSSHIIDVVEKLCDRIAIIKKGKLRACTSIKELADKNIDLEQFYLDIINAEDAPEGEAPLDAEAADGTPVESFENASEEVSPA